MIPEIMYSILAVFTVVSMVPLAFCQPECDFEPIALALTDVQVSPDIKDSFMRGITATIGSSGQQIVMLPWPELNNTIIYDQQSFCDKTIIWSDEICEVRRGNPFDQSQSDSYEKAKDIPEAGGALEEAVFEGSEKGIGKIVATSLGSSDGLSLDGSEELEDFPFAIPRQRWDHGYTFLHSLGMGRNSTYLNAMKDAGRISARVWSIFWGRMWIDEPLDGSVVVGGYDSAKVIGDNYTEALDYTDADGSGCWTGMKVIVRDIRLNFRDGSDETIFPANSALPFCIVPQKQLLMEAPGGLLAEFEALTGKNHTGDSYGLHWSAQIFDADDYYDGDITFFLDSGLEIRVPNDQFMTPFADINRSGRRTIDKSKREFLMNPLGTQPATLGRYFLTAAYLMVNHDANSFTLWKANPTSSTDLIPVYNEEAADKCKGDVPGLVQPSASASTSPLESVSPTHDSQNGEDKEDDQANEGEVDVALIAGAVGGGAGALILLTVAAYIIIRRRQKQRANATVDIAAQASAPHHYDDTYKTQYYQTSQWGAQEVAGSEPGSHEVAGSEGPQYHELDTGNYHRRASNMRRF